MFSHKIVIVNTFILFLKLPACSKCSLQEDEVSRWANELGQELWSLGKTITKLSEIDGTYKFLNVQVMEKEPQQLLKEVVTDIERMMDRKMDAVMCISLKAEEVAEGFNSSTNMYSYYSSKYSSIAGEPPVELPESLLINKKMYLTMKVNNDTHFYNLPVDTNFSSVHVPTNIYDRHYTASHAIQWTKELDDVFRQNYKSDPALSWQYFGSTTGIMRHFPGKRWQNLKTDKETDTFDCRVRTWFIEASTCTKDVVILLDNSGSMDGMGKHIGALTAFSILDTFSNNDYMNVMNYSSWTNYTVPCYENVLVQATEENIVVFKQAIEELRPQEKTDLEQALVQAFELLAKYRRIRKCSEDGSTCNQAIMIITDGVSKNYSEIVMKYNFVAGDETRPVRIFTYLVGEETVNEPEILWLSCSNKGYYTHVQSLEQVTVSVLKYIDVIARPLVLQAKVHPPSWTHAYADVTYDDATDNQINEPYRLLTSVAVPAFDRKANKNIRTKTADLLGVSGTDVPIADIEKLTLPYKVGVNAYAFIVSNNGYVIMHPDLRPVFEGILTENYNSIDLTEVEQLDDNSGPRQISDTLLHLRDALVNGSIGNITNVRILYHYDGMKRISREQYDYYYSPIKNTPFSIALAFPIKYGKYFLDVGDEILKNRHTGAKLTDFFKGDNWKVHPKWEYCKYHYLEGHEYNSSETLLRHFLEGMYNSTFKWEKQYEDESDREDLDKVVCGRKTHGDNDYYCDRELVQRLVFDARSTLGAFQGPWIYQQGERSLFERFNATLRFVATMSGLTRWEYLSEEVEKAAKKEFGDFHSNAIEETWYQSAVIQHQYDRESFVYSVPFNFDDDDEGHLVTGSYAIFINDAGKEAPASVVGFQFRHANLKRRMQEITSKISNQCPECANCDTSLDCYVIDSSGYIIVSKHDNVTGIFFGEVEGDIMKSFLDRGIFENTTVYDYQPLCKKNDSDPDAKKPPTSSERVRNVLSWGLVKMSWLFTFGSKLEVSYNKTTLNDTVTYILDAASNDTQSDIDDKQDNDDDDEWYACEKQRNLYILQQNITLPSKVEDFRDYFIKKIPYSNLLFVAIISDAAKPKNDAITYTTLPQDIVYEKQTVYPCQKVYLNKLSRRRLMGCFNQHPEEPQIKTCGRGALIKNDCGVLLTSLFLLMYRQYL